MSLFTDLASGRTTFEFPSLWRKAAVISAVLVLISLLSWGVRGLNLGIEFEGGQSWELQSDSADVDGLRNAVESLGVAVGPVQEIAGDLFRVRAQIEGADTALVNTITDALAAEAGISSSAISTNSVGPSWGEELTGKARNALIVFFIVLFIYIALRLELKMAVGAMVAVVHDILITIGVYALFQFEVTAATIIAFLTILGYSLYDTLVVFDKIKENESRVSNASQLTYSGLVSYSENQVVMRSINTTITSVLPVLSVLIIGRFILGEVTLQEFAIALLVGLLVGTYSSLFVAAPIVAWLKEREPANIARRERLQDTDTSTATVKSELASADSSRKIRSASRAEGTSSPIRNMGKGADGESTERNTRATAQSSIPARPRKKKNR